MFFLGEVGKLVERTLLRGVSSTFLLKMLLLSNPEEFRSAFFPRWIKQWRLSQVPNAPEAAPSLQSSEPEVAASRDMDGLVRPFASAPAGVGEVRLLAPGLTPSSELPVYVLVLQAWAPGWKLIAPFSRFQAAPLMKAAR